MRYAVIRTGGKQYKVSEGTVLEVERLQSEDSKKFETSDVLLYVSDGDVKIGTPFVSGVTVLGTIVEDTKGEKIRVSKFKAKARYRRVRGHRQSLSKLQIDTIAVSGEKKQVTKEPQAEEKVVKKTTKKKTT